MQAPVVPEGGSSEGLSPRSRVAQRPGTGRGRERFCPSPGSSVPHMTQAFLCLGDGGHSFGVGTEPLWGQVSHRGHCGLNQNQDLKAVWRGSTTFPRASGLGKAPGALPAAPLALLRVVGKPASPRAHPAQDDRGPCALDVPGVCRPGHGSPGTTASAFPPGTPRAGRLPAGTQGTCPQPAIV